MGPINWANSFHTNPGMNGAATALVIGILRSSAIRSPMVKGTPGGSANWRSKVVGPAQVC